MEYLKISNKGLLDMRLVYLMGGTTKADDEYKIGQFGTGLKYTLSYLCRNNLMFKIFIGGKEVNIKTITEIIRDTEFKIICVDGDKTSITTNMGMEWQSWMIIRELYANAMDEENGSWELTSDINPNSDTTEFYIQNTGDIKRVVDHWDDYFIHTKTPIYETDKFAIYEGGEDCRVYKNGFLIERKKNKKSVFYYDLKNAKINEMREYTGWLSSDLGYDVFPNLNKKCIEIFLENIWGTFEEDIDYDYSAEYGSAWREAIGNNKIISDKLYEKIIGRHPELEDDILIKVPHSLFKKLIKQFSGISLLRAGDKLKEFYETYSDGMQDKLQDCIKLLEKVGYFMSPELTFHFGVFGDKLVQAQIHFDTKEVHLSQDLESKSDFEMVLCLIEENEHFKTGFRDLTREFQTHFIELYANLLLKDAKILIEN